MCLWMLSLHSLNCFSESLYWFKSRDRKIREPWMWKYILWQFTIRMFRKEKWRKWALGSMKNSIWKSTVTLQWRHHFYEHPPVLMGGRHRVSVSLFIENSMCLQVGYSVGAALAFRTLRGCHLGTQNLLLWITDTWLATLLTRWVCCAHSVKVINMAEHTVASSHLQICR